MYGFLLRCKVGKGDQRLLRISQVQTDERWSELAAMVAEMHADSRIYRLYGEN